MATAEMLKSKPGVVGATIILRSGRDEHELRHDIDRAYYHSKIVHVVRPPRTEYDLLEVSEGIWGHIADRTETWPELARFIDALTAEMRERLSPGDSNAD